jgi:hypothetical protein
VSAELRECWSWRCRDKKAIASRSSVQEQPAAISELLDTKSQEELRQLLTDEYGEAPDDDEAGESVEDEDAQMIADATAGATYSPSGHLLQPHPVLLVPPALPVPPLPAA